MNEFLKKLLKKFVILFFTLLLVHFASKLVNYSHSESFNIRKNSEIDDSFLWWRRFVNFQTCFKDSLCLEFVQYIRMLCTGCFILNGIVYLCDKRVHMLVFNFSKSAIFTVRENFRKCISEYGVFVFLECISHTPQKQMCSRLSHFFLNL